MTGSCTAGMISNAMVAASRKMTREGQRGRPERQETVGVYLRKIGDEALAEKDFKTATDREGHHRVLRLR